MQLGQAQKLCIENIHEYPDIKYILYPWHSFKIIASEQGVYLFDGFKLTHSSKNRTQQTDLSDLLPKPLKRKLSSLDDCVYYYDKQQLVIRNANYVFIFTEVKNSFKFKSHYKLKDKYPGKSVYSVNNNIYLYGVYNEHELSDGLPSGYLKLNTTDSS